MKQQYSIEEQIADLVVESQETWEILRACVIKAVKGHESAGFSELQAAIARIIESETVSFYQRPEREEADDADREY